MTFATACLFLCHRETDTWFSEISQILDVPFGVLDVHFSPHDASLFAIATSTGSIACHRVSVTSKVQVEHTGTIQAFEKDVLVTSLSWDPVEHGRIAVTLTSGEVGVLNLPQEMLESWKDGRAQSQTYNADAVECATLFTHSLEAWTTTFLPSFWPHRGVLSGGDDAVLSFAGLPDTSLSSSYDEDAALPVPSYTNRRIHGAGVTAILPFHILLPLLDTTEAKHVYMTGSYDDNLRVLSAPHTNTVTARQPQILHEVNLGGGVWRLKFISAWSDTVREGLRRYRVKLLVSCMYAGAKIVQLQLITTSREDAKDEEEWSSEILAEMTEHESMCYAADLRPWPSNENSNHITIASCSFYDRRLCLWNM
jgi:diphthamide biosynthesis protein 7